MFEYAGYTETSYGMVLLHFINKDNNKRYSLADCTDNLEGAEREGNEQMNDEQFNQYWEDEGLDNIAQTMGEEIANYLSEAEWNTDDLILED